jgi:ABC-type iron transport system FetAB ATPase subunit
MYVTPFVANDTHVEKEKSRMKILTGPNASGKSVYLKQVMQCTCRHHVLSHIIVRRVHGDAKMGPYSKKTFCCLQKENMRIK